MSLLSWFRKRRDIDARAARPAAANDSDVSALLLLRQASGACAFDGGGSAPKDRGNGHGDHHGRCGGFESGPSYDGGSFDSGGY